MTIDRQYAESDNERGRTYQVHTALVCPDCGDVTDLNAPCQGTGYHYITAKGEVVAMFERPFYHPACEHRPIVIFGVLTTSIGSGSWFDLFRRVVEIMAGGRDGQDAKNGEGATGRSDADGPAS